MSEEQNSIAFFDFDGTITSQDSLACFLKTSLGNGRFYSGVATMLPVLVAYKLKLLSNHDAKEKFIAHFFKGWKAEEFQKTADHYSENGIDTIVRPDAAQKLDWHKKEGHTVVIVSASIECWLKRWCEINDFKLIGTQLEVQSGQITGKFKTRNCYGQEKVNRITKNYTLDEYETIYAYGDSKGDREMLDIANQPNFRCFKKK